MGHVEEVETFRARFMQKLLLHSDALIYQKHTFFGKNISYSVPDPKAHSELDTSPNYSMQAAEL